MAAASSSSSISSSTTASFPMRLASSRGVLPHCSDAAWRGYAGQRGYYTLTATHAPGPPCAAAPWGRPAGGPQLRRGHWMRRRAEGSVLSAWGVGKAQPRRYCVLGTRGATGPHRVSYVGVEPRIGKQEPHDGDTDAEQAGHMVQRCAAFLQREMGSDTVESCVTARPRTCPLALMSAPASRRTQTACACPPMAAAQRAEFLYWSDTHQVSRGREKSSVSSANAGTHEVRLLRRPPSGEGSRKRSSIADSSCLIHGPGAGTRVVARGCVDMTNGRDAHGDGSSCNTYSYRNSRARAQDYACWNWYVD